MWWFFAGFLLGFTVYAVLDWVVRGVSRGMDRSEREYSHEQFHGEPR